MTGPALELVGISRRFGSVDALREVDFTLEPGEVHGLLGENGAGKSTLMHVAYGLVRPDSGTVRVRGREITLGSPREARVAGIGMVHQHFTSIPALSVRENLWLAAGRFGSKMGQPPEDGGDLLRGVLWQGVDPEARVESLAVGAKQRLEVLQALATEARILLLDEPTAVLTPAETEQLIALLRSFAGSGGAVAMITHKLDEVFAAADRVTVLRRGAVVATGAIGRLSREALARAMVGEGGESAGSQELGPPGSGAIRVEAPWIQAKGGQIVGIAAVEGNGQRELLRSLVGLAPARGPTWVESPAAFIPEDRSTEGLIPGLNVAENLVLGLDSDPRWRSGPWIRWDQAIEHAERIIGEYHIRAVGPTAAVRTLSGGNQQKLVFARALEARPAVVIAENPTRGLDLRAARFVHDRLRAMARAGSAVIFYSTDLDEVLAHADRVITIHRGMAREAPPGADRRQVGAMMLGSAP